MYHCQWFIANTLSVYDTVYSNIILWYYAIVFKLYYTTLKALWTVIQTYSPKKFTRDRRSRPYVRPPTFLRECRIRLGYPLLSKPKWFFRKNLKEPNFKMRKFQAHTDHFHLLERTFLLGIFVRCPNKLSSQNWALCVC